VERKVEQIYLDPLDAIWLTVAERIGFRVERSREVYASTDGRGMMVIGAPDTLDPDDSLAQLVLHELCHSLIEGPRSLGVPDFGLDNVTSTDEVREHACLRLQAWLTGKHGLRRVLAPTTSFRGYYNELPEDPLEENAPAAVAARRGADRATERPWAPHLEQGLRATAKVMKVAREFGARDPSVTAPPIWASKER
jgi:hypothetical protein